ncbi:LTA synthase family protein [Granulosicoccus antarcticus]|uniref:LTA synthase family protein n=1 Tax=Granulosicoccus antarcticus TaxID=437505 RepID=UPI0012FD14C6|nr:LTA synthase family protein [Granulosicoccus antarcticus]
MNTDLAPTGTDDEPVGPFAQQNKTFLQKSLRMLARVLSVALFTLLITMACRYALESVFGLKLYSAFWLRDYLGNLGIALLAFILVQSRDKAMILTSVVVIAFQMANGAKLSVLGTPLSPDDLINIKNLFYLTDGWKRYALMLVAATPLLATLLLIPLKRRSAWVVLATLAGISFLITQYSEPLRVRLDERFGNSVWNQPDNFKRRGLALHIAQESIRTLAKVGKNPDQATIMAITSSLPVSPLILQASSTNTELGPDTGNTSNPASTVIEPAGETEPRNVHLIVLESFFDPMSLGPEWVSEDPFPASFRELWAQTGNTHALSPVFGGYTANAEFETLCGFPVTENAVFFEGWLRRQVPCLPAVLAKAGYQSVASHPNVPGFWNRTLAYKLVGFENYLSKSNFDLKDSVEGLLLDHSFYTQVDEQLAKIDTDRPFLNYMLTYHGHLPYPSNENYPDQIKPGPAGKDAILLNGYLNQIWYKSRDLMARLEKLRADDPNALIVMFGDHLPFLGPNYGVYTEAMNLPADRAQFTGDMLEYLVSTPLIVIDGEKGPLQLGKLPLYRLPSLILELLGKKADAGMLDWAQNPEGQLIRPVYGMHIDLQDGTATACPDDATAPASCETSANWLARTRLLIKDLFSGKQFSLSHSPSASPLNES